MADICAQLSCFMKIFRSKRFFLFFVLSQMQLWAVPSLSSDKPIVYDMQKQASLAEGNAEFLNKNLSVKADKIYYFSETAKALAEGNVRITNEQFRLLTEAGNYLSSEKELSCEKFRMEVFGHGVQGENLHGTTDCLYADNLIIDYNGVQKDVAGVHIHAKKGELHGHDYFALRDAVFHIGKVPLFYTPYYRHDFKHSTVRWKCDFGMIRRNKTYGRYVRNDLFLDLGWHIKPGIMFDTYRKRGILFGGMFEYDEPFGHGVFKAARVHDSDLDRYLTKNPKLKNSRYFSEWRHQGTINGSTDISVQMEWMRDKDFLEDFRPDENDATRQHPDNFAEISHRSDESVTSILARYRFNHFQRIQERLPEIRYEHMPVRWGESDLYYQYGLGISHLRERSLDDTSPERILRRMDIYGGISSPFELCPWCTFTPLASTRIAHYWGLNQPNQPKDYTRCLGQVGFDLRFRAYGEYAYENDYWDIHHLRHLIQPVIQYRYIPKGHSGNHTIPAIDREALDGKKPSLQEIDLLNRRDIDDLNDMHLLRLGLENFLYTNYLRGDPSQWLHFNIYQDVRLQKSLENGKKQRTLSDTHIDFEWNPASFVTFNQYLRVDPTEKRLRESNTSVSFKEGDLWRISCSHSYTQDGGSPTNQNSLSISYRLNSTNVISAAISIDAHKPDLISQTFTWSTIFEKTWNTDFIFKWKKRSRPLTLHSKDSWEFRVIVTFVEW